MSDNQSNNKRIAKNTLFMYFRMILVMVIALFTSRINLKTLGVVDYGIYGVVGGFVAMFAVFSNALSAAIQRFITYELAQSNVNRLKKVFSTSVTIMIILAVVLMIAAEIGGQWFINNKMVLPTARIYAATWVLHCSVLTFGVGLISVAYNAAIIAHEKMSTFAYISIYDVVAKLVICYCLYISPIDRLILWAVMLALLQLSIQVIYMVYCRCTFAECKYTPTLDKPLFKEIASYAGWSTFGLVALTCYTQGLNMVLNIFFGPIVNAARSIAVQVQSAIQGFSTNFQVAMNPQIIKSYAISDMERMHQLLFVGTRFCFYLLLFLSLPIILETSFILAIWLGEYPEHTVNFIRLVLIIITLDSSLGGPISTAQTATGKIKVYQIIVGGIMLSILPIAYFILKIWSTSPETVYLVYMTAVVVAHIARMFIIRPMIKLSLKKYFFEVVKPIAAVSMLSLPLPLMAYVLLPQGKLSSFLLVCFICVVFVGIAIWTVGLKNTERQVALVKIKSTIKKIR